MNIDIKLVDSVDEGHMTFGEQEQQIWREVKDITSFTKILEIGTNAGHSAALVLSMFDDTIVHSIDHHTHDYTYESCLRLKMKFKDRFNYMIGDSTTCSYLFNYYDVAFIDGSHFEPDVMSDIDRVQNSGIKYLLLDDLNDPDVLNAAKRSELVLIKEWTYTNNYGTTSIGLYK